MTKKRGKFIVFEGIDASGKATQTKLLVDYLKHAGLTVNTIGFPQYGQSFFGKMIGEYLDGQFGDLKAVAPRLTALMYAGDRFEARAKIMAQLAAGEYVVADRYVGSNLVFQSARVPINERLEFIGWLEKLEYGVYKLPKEDANIYLNISVELSQKLVRQKHGRIYTSKKADLYEDNPLFLSDVAYRYRWFVEQYPRWHQMESLDGLGNLRTREAVHGDIIKLLQAEDIVPKTARLNRAQMDLAL